MIFLRPSEDVLLDELLDVVEVATLADGIVMVTIRKLLPNRRFRFAQSEQLFHMRRSDKTVSVLDPDRVRW